MVRAFVRQPDSLRSQVRSEKAEPGKSEQLQAETGRVARIKSDCALGQSRITRSDFPANQCARCRCPDLSQKVIGDQIKNCASPGPRRQFSWGGRGRAPLPCKSLQNFGEAISSLLLCSSCFCALRHTSLERPPSVLFPPRLAALPTLARTLALISSDPISSHQIR